MSDVDGILRKVRALRARAADDASTEAEAALAARKAAELLARYNISLTELDVRADGVCREEWESGQSTRPVEVLAHHGIERLAGVQCWYSGGTISVVGAPADVETALYFLDLVRAAVRNCWSRFQTTSDYAELRRRGASARRIGSSFRKGVAVRLGERMAAMAEPLATSEVGDGRSLLIVKAGLIEQWKRENRIRLAGRPTSISDRRGFLAGRNAAEGVALVRGVAARRLARLPFFR